MTSMSSVTDLPVLIYLNEPFVNQQTQLLEEGAVEHIIEEYGESEETATSGGLNIYQVLRFEREKTTGSTENTAKKVRRTPIGNFAVYHGLLEDSDDLGDLTELDEVGREDLDDDGFIRATGSIRRTPIGAFDHIGEKYGLYNDHNISDPDNQQAYAEVKEAATYFEMPMQHLDGCFVFKLEDEYFQDVEPGFPDERREYTVVGEIRHVYEPGEKKHHLDIVNAASSSRSSHQERAKQRRSFKRMANQAEKFMGRAISEDDYYRSYPDIQVDIIAIYR